MRDNFTLSHTLTQNGTVQTQQNQQVSYGTVEIQRPPNGVGRKALGSIFDDSITLLPALQPSTGKQVQKCDPIVKSQL